MYHSMKFRMLLCVCVCVCVYKLSQSFRGYRVITMQFEKTGTKAACFPNM
jgi:hypothetical protein